MWDVARAAGVSQKTVSRVVNGEPNVSDGVRRRIEQAIADLGYRPNKAAQALVTSRTRTVGMVSVGGTLLGPSLVLESIERALRAHGYSLMLYRTETNDPARFAAAIDALLNERVEAIVVSEPGDSVLPLEPDSLGVPVLVLEDQDPGEHDWLIAASDTRGGTAAMTRHLLEAGHRTVHHVAGPEGWGTSETRLEGWRTALGEAGRPVPQVLRGDWSAASGYAAGRELATDPDVTAVLCANDEMAVGLLRAFQETGREAPDDVAVAGMDDAPMSAYLHVPLSTVRVDFIALAEAAVQLLLGALRGEQTAARRVIPTKLVLRRSTESPEPGTPATE